MARVTSKCMLLMESRHPKISAESPTTFISYRIIAFTMIKRFFPVMGIARREIAIKKHIEMFEGMNPGRKWDGEITRYRVQYGEYLKSNWVEL